MTMTSGYANVNGLKMYYEIHGTGKPMVLLHGGLLTIDLSFSAILPALAKNRQVIAVELQGHGHTADIDRDLTLQFLANDVVALLDHLDIERADLFGYSFGGLVALQVAMTYPERVDRLIAAATHFRADGYHNEILDPKLWESSTRMPTENDFQQMREAHAAVAPDPSQFDSTMAKAQPVVDSVDGWSLDDLRGITAATLLVIGDHDFVRIEHAAQMHELIKNSQLAILPNTTHMGLVRRADLLMPPVEGFLQESDETTIHGNTGC
jgi:pimeloyl-ACP methyl ester carboxylesterase